MNCHKVKIYHQAYRMSIDLNKIIQVWTSAALPEVCISLKLYFKVHKIPCSGPCSADPAHI